MWKNGLWQSVRGSVLSLVKNSSNVVADSTSNSRQTHKIRKVIITSPHTYKPVGPYSQAVLVDKTLYVSGVLGLDACGKMVGDNNVEEQTRQVLDNLNLVLKAGGASLESVVKATILLNDLKDFPVVNKVYQEYFTKEFPARSTFQVGKLPLNAALEIEAIAISDKPTVC